MLHALYPFSFQTFINDSLLLVRDDASIEWHSCQAQRLPNKLENEENSAAQSFQERKAVCAQMRMKVERAKKIESCVWDDWENSSEAFPTVNYRFNNGNYENENKL